MSINKIELMKFHYEVESQGSIDPNSSAYRRTWSYIPSKEESDKYLDEVLVNGKATLREYFQALSENKKEFLENLKYKPQKNKALEELGFDPRVREGGSNERWSILAGINGEVKFKISHSTEGYSISEFPKVTFEKAKSQGFNAHGTPLKDSDIPDLVKGKPLPFEEE
ncbi:MAG: hypothetical protein K9K67_15410 [Bacteriovoracaceae bacterium]|nr:hypothetical protein [Bacteriovoracaceae bacterium]